jgi:hypothetical protein
MARKFYILHAGTHYVPASARAHARRSVGYYVTPGRKARSRRPCDLRARGHKSDEVVFYLTAAGEAGEGGGREGGASRRSG